MRTTLTALLLLTSGCLVQNMSAEEHLRDAVTELNEGLRWSRMDVAIPRVAPEYRPRFAEAHREWGRVVRIADAELIGVRIGQEREEAISTIAIRWYSYNTMTIHEAIIQQQWERKQGGYYLVEERVVQGDPNLLAPPPEPSDEEGDDGTDPPVTSGA